jgi:FlaA1/EpsC-like NDP-sugar epimerase
MQKDDIDRLPVMFYVRWWHAVTSLFALKTWAILSIVFAFVVAAFWILFIIAGKPETKRRFFWVSLFISFIFVLLLLITIRNYNHQQEEKEAIVFTPVITGKSSPDADSKDLFVIHEGLKVHILNKIGEWYEVRLPDGTVGWLPGESIRVI